MDLRGRTISAPWVWLEGKFQADVQLRVDDHGRIAAIIRADGDRVASSADVVHLGNVALMPGFVNVHSHAFHRCLRGRSQIGGGSGADNFWKWRQNMYKVVDSVDFARLKEICADTFREMLSAGITTVGEFHYVHHADQKAGGRYALDVAVAEAASQVGIRLVLIETLYMRAGFNSDSVESDQWRFASRSVDEFIDHVEQLRSTLISGYDGLVSLALAVHSLRAVPLPQARQLFQFAQRHGLPLHIHLEEQPAELEDCRSVHQGRTPGELLLQEVVVGEAEQSLDMLTAVHCTQSQRPLLDELARRRANICVCPCTEGYLADGVPLLAANDQLCLGTDCNNRIAMLEEMRWMAFCQNMRTNTRNCAGLNASKLLEAATKNGAKSLGLEDTTGEFAVGKLMDFLAMDLQSPRLAQFVDCQQDGNGEKSSSQLLLDAIVFGAGNAEVLMSGVAGQVRFGKRCSSAGAVPRS